MQIEQTEMNVTLPYTKIPSHTQEVLGEDKVPKHHVITDFDSFRRALETLVGNHDCNPQCEVCTLALKFLDVWYQIWLAGKGNDFGGM